MDKYIHNSLILQLAKCIALLHENTDKHNMRTNTNTHSHTHTQGGGGGGQGLQKLLQ